MFEYMSRVYLVIAVVLFVNQSPLTAQDIPEDNNEWVSVKRALELASREDKFILIDVYAAWCPYCQRMQEEVYPNTIVEEQIDNYFVPVRINTESRNPVNFLGTQFTEEEFAGALNYSSVPTTYFMNQQGEIIGQQPGFLPADIFSRLLKYVGSGAFEEMTFEEFEN